MTFASPEKVKPVNEKTGVEQAHKDVTCENADCLLLEEDNPQLDFIEESSHTNERITEETTTCNNPGYLFAGAANSQLQWKFLPRTSTGSNNVTYVRLPDL